MVSGGEKGVRLVPGDEESKGPLQGLGKGDTAAIGPRDDSGTLLGIKERNDRQTLPGTEFVLSGPKL